MERKSLLSKRKAKRLIKAQDSEIGVVSSPEIKTLKKRGVKFYLFILTMLILNGFTYSYWLTDFFDDSIHDPITQTDNLPQPNKNARDVELPPDWDSPPQNIPVDMGYNASSGQLPPGALPPGVRLPGISGMNSAITQGYGVNDGIRQNFTGQIKDTESNLLYYGARYYNPRHGRFTSPDRPFADQQTSDPQSWNMYSYAGNNPLKYNDPLGLWKQIACSTGGQSGSCWQWEEGDDWGTLAWDSGIGLAYDHSRSLGKFFDGTGLEEGTIVDVSGYNGWLGTLDVRERIGLQSPQFDVDFGGAGVIRSAANKPGIFSRIWNGIFGSGSKSATAAFAGGVTREAIERAAADPGGTVTIATKLAQSPQVGRQLYAWEGGTEAVANQAIQSGQVYTAKIPKALVETLRNAGLVRDEMTIMNGVQQRALVFSPEAAEFIVKFFK